MKKKIYRSLLLLVAVFSSASCSFLDFDETDAVFTHDDMYEYFNKTTQMLTNVYTYMPQDFGTISGAMRDCGCDDAEYADVNSEVQKFNNGGWSSIATVDTQWKMYKGIRCANEFLASIANADFSKFKDDPRYNNWMKQFSYYEYEARMLRAFYFFELARRYGGIAMPLEVLDIQGANSIQKTSWEDVVAFIVRECDVCAGKLPEDYAQVPGNEYGRITKGAAMALKSKILLYAASRLHNPDMDVEKWKQSAQAALDLIATELYTLDPGEKTNTTLSPEVVLCRMNNFNNSFELKNFPIRFTQGRRSGLSGVFPTQELVDAFQTESGYDVTLTERGWVSDDPAFQPEHPYERRDPRFARTVLADGMPFKKSEIETFVGGADYSETRDKGTPTGYYLRKYIIESTDFTPENEKKGKHHWVIYRFAETLLTYAESMIEAFGDPDYTDAVFTMSAREALDKVRLNAGMPVVNAVTKEEFIAAVRREWRVEFAFEDHRFWDIRRWGIGRETQTSISGVRIEKKESGKVYTRELLENREWNDRMNLYPIPQDELFNNPNLGPQNPGW